MKNLSKLFSLLLFVFAISFSSCDDDVLACNDTAIELEGNQLAAAIALATSEYLLDDSSANCTAFKDASQDLVDFLSGNIDCAGTDTEKQRAQDDIKALESSIKKLPC